MTDYSKRVVLRVPVMPLRDLAAHAPMGYSWVTQTDERRALFDSLVEARSVLRILYAVESGLTPLRACVDQVKAKPAGTGLELGWNSGAGRILSGLMSFLGWVESGKTQAVPDMAPGSRGRVFRPGPNAVRLSHVWAAHDEPTECLRHE